MNLLLNVLLALAWAALTGNFEPVNLVFGFGMGYLVLWMAADRGRKSPYFRRLPRAIEFVLFMLKEMVLANLRMAIIVLSPKPRLRPAVVAIPLDLQSEAAIALLANMITLTPGTLSLDVSTDRKTLFVHVVWLNDPASFIHGIKTGYEMRVKEILEAK